jgi:Spherulation-specific family 4/PEP-CTERM motif
VRRFKRVFRSVSLFIVMVVTGTMGSPAPATAGGIGVLVPAYFYPGTGGPGGVGDGWAAMAAEAGTVPITAIFNPNSGPLPGLPDPNYITAMTNLELAGGSVVAYVDTDYGATPLATVEGEINTYLSQYGNLTSNPLANLINGFFFDRMSNDPSEVSYYQSLYSFVKSLSTSYGVIGNPGTATNSSYLAASPPTASTFVTYEGSAAGYTSANTSTGSSSLYANIIYDQSTVAGMQANVAFAAQNNVGYVYVTDQPLNPPTGYLYDQLPSYWDQEVAAVSAASVPEPGALALLASGCVLSMLGIAVRRRTQGQSS